MSNNQLEKRLTALEAEVALLKEQQQSAAKSLPWWKATRGTFANDPMFEEAMRLGREYRESLRPKPKRKKKVSVKKNGAAGHRSR